MRKFLALLLVGILIPLGAIALEPVPYPENPAGPEGAVLIAPSCIDLKNARTLLNFGFTQDSGSPDGKCDSDSRILAGASVTGNLGPMGPFTLPDGVDGFILLVDATTAPGGGNDVCVQVKSLLNPGTFVTVRCMGSYVGFPSTGLKEICWGSFLPLAGTCDYPVNTILPKTFYLQYVHSTGTTTGLSWTFRATN